MLYESCACPEGRLGAPLVSQRCFPGVLRTRPASALRALTRRRVCAAGTLCWREAVARARLRTALAPTAAQRLARASQQGRSTMRWSNSAPGPPEHPRKASPPKLAKKGASARLRKKPAATELLSEHCFAGKCSTSHVVAQGEPWERSWLAGAASQASCAPAQ